MPRDDPELEGLIKIGKLNFFIISLSNFSLGDVIDVRINEARPFSLTGELYL